MVRFYCVVLFFFIKVLFSSQKLKEEFLKNRLFIYVLISFCLLVLTYVCACVNMFYACVV